MKYLLSKNSKSLEPIGNFKLNKAIGNLTKYFKKLMALSLLATLALATGACDGKKTSAQKAKTQLETLGIDASKAFFVTPSGKATNDGSSWQKSMDLQTAINAAATNATKEFVLVAVGSYYADPNKTDVTKTFILKDGVKIYGGFDVNAKKLTRYKDASILEGKLKAKEGANVAIHSKQILTGTSLSATSILDGFLIQNALNADNGNSTDYPKNYIKGAALFLNNSSPQLNNLSFNNNKLTGSWSVGGAIYNNNSSPSINNATFSNNSANRLGGAISNDSSSSPSISNATFSNNSAEYRGGAIYNWKNSSPSISNATFSKNSSKIYGGAIYNSSSSPSISNASFSNNSANWSGGAIYNSSSSPSISNASFSNNSAKWGGAIFNSESSNPNISNATFSNNSAGNYGGAIYNYKSSPKIYNSILWNNKDKHKGTEAINNIYNYEVASKPIIKNSILNGNSAVTKQGDDNQTDYSKTDPYNFMDYSKPEFKDNQTPATFSIYAQGKVASANQVLIKDKGDNALYLEVYDKIKGNPANTTTTIPSDDKDLADNPRLKGSKIDIGAYEIQD